jgi:hypothetical protein
MEPKSKQVRMVAMLSMVVLSVLIGGDLLSIYQTHYQLASPFIPDSVIAQITGPMVSVTIVSSFCCVAGWILFFFKRYVWVIVLCGLALVWQEVYRYFIS